jgi:hypothetical protein
VQQRLEDIRFLDRWIKPAVVTIRLQNDWHAVVNCAQQVVGFRRQQRTGLDRFALVVPGFPKAGKGERLPVAHAEVVRLFLAFQALPFIKTIGQDQAATLAKRRAEGRFLGGRFRACIDEPIANPRIICPGWNQTQRRKTNSR